MILQNNEKINFIIGEHREFSTKMSRGGHIMIHLLARKIAERGHNVYIFAKPIYPHDNINLIPQTYWEDPAEDSNIATWSYDQFFFPIEKTVSIYPSEIVGNPYGTKHNVRWILDNVDPTIEETWEDDDVYYIDPWSRGRFKGLRKKDINLLSVIDYFFEDFYAENKHRKGFCYIHHKYTPENAEEIISQFNPTVIAPFDLRDNDPNSFLKKKNEYLRNFFNEHEYILTFDDKSYLPVAAALCGCKAVILRSPVSPDFHKKLTPTEYRLENNLAMFGVAYGIEDISWANSTIHLTRDHLKELEKIDEKSIDRFIEFWKTRLNM